MKLPVGVYTNGYVASKNSSAMLVEVETSAGPRVVTSPLSVEPETQLSGRARLSGGQAVVELEAGIADMLLHTPTHQYRVLVTAAEVCNGLAVTERDVGRFVVQEVGGGTSDAEFDWLLIAHLPAELGAAEPQRLPSALPALEIAPR